MRETERYAEEVLAYFQKLADLRQGLIDSNEVSGFIQILVRKPVEDERKALEAEGG